MSLLHIFILAIIQGVAELLPVSSSAHVIVAEKLLGLDPTTPQMTLLLVMLHTGTMFAVIVYFWKSWHQTYFSSAQQFRTNGARIFAATAVTGLIGLALIQMIKHFFFRNAPGFEIEQLFGSARLMAAALASAGILIILSSRRTVAAGTKDVSMRSALWIGAVQGLCLPFRGFSRSGATISTGLTLGVDRRRAEQFSFALAVVLTPVVIVKEVYRLHKVDMALSTGETGALWHSLGPGLLGMVLSFLMGLVALHWLSQWLEQGRWYIFGAYCLFASLVVLWIG